MQDCPGNLIFDPGLLICNWPESTTCIKHLRTSDSIPIKLESEESEPSLHSESLFSEFIPTVPTAITVQTSEAVGGGRRGERPGWSR